MTELILNTAEDSQTSIKLRAEGEEIELGSVHPLSRQY